MDLIRFAAALAMGVSCAAAAKAAKPVASARANGTAAPLAATPSELTPRVAHRRDSAGVGFNGDPELPPPAGRPFDAPSRIDQDTAEGPAGALESRLRELEQQFDEQRFQLEVLQQQLDVDRQARESAAQAAAAADAAAKAKGYTIGSNPQMNGVWNNGMTFQSPNKDFWFHVGGRTQVDFVGVQSPGNSLSGAGGVGAQDTVDFRRARLRAEGTMYEFIDWCVEYNFVGAANLATPNPATPGTVANVPQPTDLWWNFRQLPWIGNFTIGNIKETLWPRASGKQPLSRLHGAFVQSRRLYRALEQRFRSGPTDLELGRKPPHDLCRGPFQERDVHALRLRGSATAITPPMAELLSLPITTKHRTAATFGTWGSAAAIGKTRPTRFVFARGGRFATDPTCSTRSGPTPVPIVRIAKAF